MEQWQIEIKRLDKIRLTLGLNYSKLQVLVNKDRGYLKRIFELQTVPSLSVYFELKNALENEHEVKFAAEGENSQKKESIFENLDCDCRLENNLLKRGKIKCKKTKAEHNF